MDIMTKGEILKMHGMLKEIKQTNDDVFFEILDVRPSKNEECIEYVLLNIKGKGIRLARTLMKNERISYFSSSNILFSDDQVVYILLDCIEGDEKAAVKLFEKKI